MNNPSTATPTIPMTLRLRPAVHAAVVAAAASSGQSMNTTVGEILADALDV